MEEARPGHSQYVGCLSIPYLRWSQEFGWSVVSIRFRRLDDSKPKYLTVAGDRPRLYNTMSLLKQSPIIAITEGEIDCVSAEACGIPAVGVAGVQTWQKHFREPFLGYREVFVLADGDEPGLKFAEDVAQSLPNAKVIPSPPGMDVNSFVLQHGPDALREKLK